MIREANRDNLHEILNLYFYLHETNIPENSQELRNTWDDIIMIITIILSFVKWIISLWHPVSV